MAQRTNEGKNVNNSWSTKIISELSLNITNVSIESNVSIFERASSCGYLVHLNWSPVEKVMTIL